jgi:hypothetical protein
VDFRKTTVWSRSRFLRSSSGKSKLEPAGSAAQNPRRRIFSTLSERKKALYPTAAFKTKISQLNRKSEVVLQKDLC